MANLGGFFSALVISLIVLNLNSVDAQFPESAYYTFGGYQSTMWDGGEDLQLVLTNNSGTGIQSYRPYLYGSIEMNIKLVSGNSAGTVTTFYLSSTGSQHDEIDFEFLGNVSGQPYTIHTNIFTQGVGGKEVQFKPWFDPTSDYHNYTIHWNPSEIVWFVDSLPIRVFRNYESRGFAFPSYQGMWVYSSLWDADGWATQGGSVKTDWSCAPFTAELSNFTARACEWIGPVSIYQCAANTPSNWWTSPVYSQLSFAQLGQMDWVRANYIIYNYCTDYKRFNWNMPPECSLPEY